MSCRACRKPFSHSKRENGCPGCDHTYCKDCLKYEHYLPDTSDVKEVCKYCHKRIIDSKPFIPPADFIVPDGINIPLDPEGMTAQLDKLEKSNPVPKSLYKEWYRLDNVNLSPGERQIAKRFHNMEIQKQEDQLILLDERRPEDEAPTKQMVSEAFAALSKQNFHNNPKNVDNSHQVCKKASEGKKQQNHQK
ncbi:uncharacterized protein LOC106649665 [Trichogramma pretiosum]|uniref:uncharacterized protein LOC106649665 n=1 Tax=Trichogramma pretiosum TaxID=7493 RepID=UPI0006C93C3B|nr:uncharacterized protein LOC106649665 [Trichogramma pretiosum]